MNGTSLNITKEKIDSLKQILPEVFTEEKIDWEKLKATLGENINFANERYVLNWAGKSDAFKTLQTPTTKTLIPAKEESVNFDDTEHIFIEGENLEVLKVLQQSYFGKIKMIYIDPPYNTGNDSFIYPDKFSETKREYQERVGDKDEEGYMTKDGMFRRNSKENGQYHSNWLNMMMPRLYLAKNLLRQDGVIFISIDDNEVHNLRLLMNEIFGEENSLTKAPTALIWQQAGTTAGHFAKAHEYVLCYAKNKESLSFFSLENYGNDKIIAHGALKKISRANPASEITFPKGSIEFAGDNAVFEGEIGGSEKQIIRDKLIFKDGLLEKTVTITAGWAMKEQILSWLNKKETFDTKGQKIIRFYFNNSGILWYEKERGTIHPKTILEKKTVGTKTGANELNLLLNGNFFENPKPISLIKYLISFALKNNDIILDFFAGSCTTAHALMDLNKEDCGNRKYICVQLPELTDEKSEAYKAGYKTIADIAKERIRRAGKKIETEIKEDINKTEAEIMKLQGELPTEETKAEIENLKEKIEQLASQDLGFKVLKLSDSNFKQWQQIEGKDAQALTRQMKLFVDPVAEHATVENMVYELLLKSGKDLNSKIFPSSEAVSEKRDGKKRNSQNYFNLPYNPKLKERARELRQAGNLSEVLFWNQVKSKQFKGLDFDRQKIIGNYIVDFYCSNCNVVIEIDGSSHVDKVEYDNERDAYLESLGLVVIHIPVAEVMNNMSGIMEMLFNHPALEFPDEKEENHPALKGTPPQEGNLSPDYYVINDGELVLLLEKAAQDIIDSVLIAKPVKVIALDKIFKGNDQLKTNTVLQMRDAGVEFKTI